MSRPQVWDIQISVRLSEKTLRGIDEVAERLTKSPKHFGSMTRADVIRALLDRGVARELAKVSK